MTVAGEKASQHLASTEISVDVDGGAARVRLDGPRTKNALDEASAAALVAACDRIDEDESIGVVVVEGLHGAFCSGAARHLLAGLATASAASAYEGLSRLYRAFARVHELTVPTVAVIDGPAVGAGLNLALVADLRFATDRARFVSGFAHNGIHPGGGHLYLLEQAGGRDLAAAMGLCAETLDASGAQAKGLVWRAGTVDEISRIVRRVVAVHASDPALARAVKSSLQLTTGRGDWPAATEVERARQMWSLTPRP